MKTTEEIYQTLLAAFAQRAGFTPEADCDLAVRLYAAAAELQALGIQSEWVLDQSFPQTARGVYLDYHAQMRGIARTAATKAVGTLRFSVERAPSTALSIAAGTACMTEGETRFQTTAEAVLAAGELSVDAPAEALEPGRSGNAAAGTIVILTACPVGITGCTNPAPFTGGSDQEDDASLRSRILESYQRLPNGANAAWYEQTAMGHEGVAAARAVGRARGIGTVDVYIATAAGLPNGTLLAAVQADLQERREIAVDVQVKAPAAVEMDVSAELAVREGADFSAVKAAAEQALASFFSGHRPDDPGLRNPRPGAGDGRGTAAGDFPGGGRRAGGLRPDPKDHSGHPALSPGSGVLLPLSHLGGVRGRRVHLGPGGGGGIHLGEFPAGGTAGAIAQRKKAAALTGGGLSLRRKRLGGLLSENHIKAEKDKWFCGADNIFLHFADCKFWDFPVYCIYRDAYRVWRQAYPVT